MGEVKLSMLDWWGWGFKRNYRTKREVKTSCGTLSQHDVYVLLNSWLIYTALHHRPNKYTVLQKAFACLPSHCLQWHPILSP